jgi:hypothetical protein
VATQVAYFRVMGSIGAVTAGVLNGLRAVLGFLSSAYLFCGVQESQCLSISR